MITSIKKWGNSQAIRIPKNILDSINLKENDEINITTKENLIVIEKVDKKRKNIKELFADFEGEYEGIDIDWGSPVGDEIW